jgi:hypothetical protein
VLAVHRAEADPGRDLDVLLLQQLNESLHSWTVHISANEDIHEDLASSLLI